MKKITLILPLLLLVSCGLFDGLLTVSVKTEPIQGVVTAIVVRHDTYVGNDESLSTADRTAFFKESFELREAVMGLPQIPKGELAWKMAPVVDRHDHYVLNDPNIGDFERGVFLRSSKLLVELTRESQ